MTSEGTPRFHVRIDPDIRKRAQSRATRAGTNLSELVRDFIEAYERDDDTITSGLVRDFVEACAREGISANTTPQRSAS